MSWVSFFIAPLSLIFPTSGNGDYAELSLSGFIRQRRAIGINRHGRTGLNTQIRSRHLEYEKLSFPTANLSVNIISYQLERAIIKLTDD